MGFFDDEVKQRWGDSDMYIESEEKTRNRSMKDEKEMIDAANDIFATFGKAVGNEPGGQEVQALVKKWHDYINEYQYECSLQVLSELGDMYVSDSRFTEFLDKNGEGTAKLMHDGIKVYCGLK